MHDGRGFSDTFGTRLVVSASIAGLLISAAQAQVQQVPYPPSGQSYPGSTPAYPNPSYPNPGPTYPNSSYPNSGYPAPQPAYPMGNQGYPYNNQLNGGYPAAMPGQPQSHFFRDLFAGTIAAVLQTTTGGLLTAIAGRIMDWFTHKTQNPPQGYNPAAPYPGSSQYPNTGYAAPNAYPPAPTYPNAGYPSTSAGNPGAAYPPASYPPIASPGGVSSTNTYPGAPQTYPPPATSYPPASGAYPNSGSVPAYPNSAYPNSTYPNSGYPNAGYPPANSAGVATAYGSTTAQAYGMATPQYGAAPPQYGTTAPQVYDARTGQMVTGAANPYTTLSRGMEKTIYAGIAYEVHAIGAGGELAPVHAPTYNFHTGDKFMVYYRPSLPGHMEIYNVNPNGQKTLIDSSNMAAGQMVGLGPYQFTNQTGDETLQLILTPCSSPQLLATTRDIVRMDAPPQASPQPPPQAVPATPAVRLGSCDAPVARGVNVHTRNIEKVGLEGTTNFALDPLSAQEMNSGQVMPREVSIVFHHR